MPVCTRVCMHARKCASVRMCVWGACAQVYVCTQDRMYLEFCFESMQKQITAQEWHIHVYSRLRIKVRARAMIKNNTL